VTTKPPHSVTATADPPPSGSSPATSAADSDSDSASASRPDPAEAPGHPAADLANANPTHPSAGPAASAARTITAADAATAAATETLLNCYLRETDGWRFEGDQLVVPLRRLQADVVVTVRYRSPTLRHRFAWPARLAGRGTATVPVGYATLASMLLDELHPAPSDARAGTEAPTRLLARMLESLHNVTEFLDLRRDEVDRSWSADPLPFIRSEQALLLGHPLHPTPKSRSEMSPRERRLYSPETQGRFPLRWLAAAPHVVKHASATGTPAPLMTEQLARAGGAANAATVDAVRDQWPDRLLLPAHPWELEHLQAQPEVADLFERGALVDLGPLGDPVTPTTSVRTVYGESWPWQLKFSLHVRVTNSLRVTLPKELDRAVESARLAQTEVGRQAAQVAPDFLFVQDPAYMTVVDEDGRVIDGFSVLLRENHWPMRAGGNVSAVATLCQDHPFGGPSRLARIVLRLAEREGRPAGEVGREWFARFLDVAVRSLVRLYLDLGLCFEPHQQNTLLELGPDGMPRRCAYRDSQGYFHRELAHADMCAIIPGLGEATESIFPEALADERLVYYPFLNLTLGVINALGAGGVADESVLLGDLRRLLEVERAQPGRYPPTLLDRLLDDDRWPCKANLRTRFHDLDELVGDISVQSVYVTIPNPLRTGIAS
jgi:siderophore synthetase component